MHISRTRWLFAFLMAAVAITLAKILPVCGADGPQPLSRAGALIGPEVQHRKRIFAGLV